MADLEAQFDEETGEIHVIEFKTVVETVENPDLEISLEEALAIEDDPDLQTGDQIGLLLPTEEPRTHRSANGEAGDYSACSRSRSSQYLLGFQGPKRRVWFPVL